MLKCEDFKQALENASENPDDKDSKGLNSKLIRILSFIRKDLPFSPLERSQLKATFSSMSMAHSFQSVFLTVAPPEQDDLLLLKFCLIRNFKCFNRKHMKDPSALFDDNDFVWDNLPDNLRNSPRARLLMSQKMPP